MIVVVVIKYFLLSFINIINILISDLGNHLKKKKLKDRKDYHKLYMFISLSLCIN